MNERLAIVAEPYTFQHASEPHGWRYCLRHIKEGKVKCIEHGIVFGAQDAIITELGEASKGMPISAPPWPIQNFGLCHRKPKTQEYIRTWPTRRRGPRKGATELEWRIYLARRMKRWRSRYGARGAREMERKLRASVSGRIQG